MKKNILYFVIIIISGFQLNAQTPSWMWAKRAGGTLADEGNAITTDAAGNIYATGYFVSPSIIFGNVTLINSDSNGNSENVYIVKYNTMGNVIWARTLNDKGSDYANGITADLSGNIYVTGGFNSDTIYFGVSTLINAGDDDVFIAKFDSSGNALWAKSAGGGGPDYASSISADDSGNVFITGTFISSSIMFDSIKIRNAGTGCCAQDIFIAKYTSTGKLLWAKGAGGTGSDYGRGIATDNLGNVYITGQFGSSSIIFGKDTLVNNVSLGGGKIMAPDIFLAKYDPNGNVLWAKDAGGNSVDYACSIATLNADVYITGAFASDTINFDTIKMVKPFSAGSCNIFITKYDSSGNPLWARQPDCAKILGDNIGYSINTSANGKINITGTFLDSTISFGSSSLLNDGYTDIFIAQYDTSGNAQFAVSAGGNVNDYGNGITADENGYIYITGYFEDSIIVFGNTPALVNAGGEYNPPDIFVSKLNPGLTVGINTKPEQNLNIVSVYPNPANITFTVGIPISSTNIRIYNSLGQNIVQAKVTGETKEYFSLNESGIYLISVTTAEGIITKKVVVY